MLASFNYYEPPLVVWVLGSAILLAVHALIIWKIDQLWLGAVADAFGTGATVAAVFACGKGDMTGLLVVCFGIVGFVGGALVGLAGSALGRASRRPRPPEQ